MTNDQYRAILTTAKQSLETDYMVKHSYERQNCMSIEEMNKLYALIEDELKTLRST
jgi:hypothetical protein